MERRGNGVMVNLAPFLLHDARNPLYSSYTSIVLSPQKFDGGTAFSGRLGEPVGEIVLDGRIRIQIAFFDGLLNHHSLCPIGLSAIYYFTPMVPCRSSKQPIEARAGV